MESVLHVEGSTGDSCEAKQHCSVNTSDCDHSYLVTLLTERRAKSGSFPCWFMPCGGVHPMDIGLVVELEKGFLVRGVVDNVV